MGISTGNMPPPKIPSVSDTSRFSRETVVNIGDDDDTTYTNGGGGGKIDIYGSKKRKKSGAKQANRVENIKDYFSASDTEAEPISWALPAFIGAVVVITAGLIIWRVR